jgi:hypothetical protein
MGLAHVPVGTFGFTEIPSNGADDNDEVREPCTLLLYVQERWMIHERDSSPSGSDHHWGYIVKGLQNAIQVYKLLML